MTNAVFASAESRDRESYFSCSPSPLQVQPVRYIDEKNNESRDVGNPLTVDDMVDQFLLQLCRGSGGGEDPKFPRTSVVISAIMCTRIRRS